MPFLITCVDLIPDNLRAVKDGWFVGDKFLGGAFPSFHAKYREGKLSGRNKPYCFDFFTAITLRSSHCQ